MSSRRSEHQILDVIESQLQSEDPQLTASFAAFTSVTNNADMPSAEQLNEGRLAVCRRRRPRTDWPGYAPVIQSVVHFLAGMVVAFFVGMLVLRSWRP